MIHSHCDSAAETEKTCRVLNNVFSEGRCHGDMRITATDISHCEFFIGLLSEWYRMKPTYFPQVPFFKFFYFPITLWTG